MKRIIFFACAIAALVSCAEHPNTDEIGGILVPPVQRLMLYFPLDSLDANGDTIYHTIPEVSLIAQNGKEFRSSDFKNKIVVADFFFTSCGGTCPRMNSQMSRIQQALATDSNLRLISYTVDPERDSVPALQKYAERFKADTAQWKFLTGPKKVLYDLARYGYFLAVQPGNGDSEDFIHSPDLVLLDRHSRVRGYYNGTDSALVDSLIVDIKILMKEK